MPVVCLRHLSRRIRHVAVDRDRDAVAVGLLEGARLLDRLGQRRLLKRPPSPTTEPRTYIVREPQSHR